MDHRISKDMISSGMIPSGEKKQEDLGKTQYGTVPSPNALADVYKKMYETKEEVINEHHKKDADGNTIPHEDEEIKEDKKYMKESFTYLKEQYDLVYEHFIGEGFSEEETFEKMSNLTEEQLEEFMKGLATRAAQYGANLGKSPERKVDYIGGITAKDTKRKPFEPNTTSKRKPFDAVKPGEAGFKAKSPTDVVMSAAAMNRKKQTVSNKTEQVDTYDIVLDHFLNEGYEREDILKVMSTVNLTEEPITATLAAIGAGLMKGAAVAGKAAVAAGTKGLAAAGKGLAAGGKAAIKGVVSAAKPVTQGVSKSATAVKDLAGKGVSSAKDIASKGISNVGQQVKKVTSSQPSNKISPTGGSGEDRLKRLGDYAKREGGNMVRMKVLQGGQPSGTDKTKQTSAPTTNVAASADLFDIVKGQLLDEGLTEEEIKDIMLTLTPDEIMEELSDNIKRIDAANKAKFEGSASEKVKAASRRQMKAGTASEDPKNPYTTADKKTIIDANKKPVERGGGRTDRTVGSYREKPSM